MVEVAKVKVNAVPEVDPLLEIRREWNSLVEGLIQAEESWEKLRELTTGIRNKDMLDLVLQKYLVRVCGTSKFTYALESFVRLLGYRGLSKDLLIEEKEDGTK